MLRAASSAYGCRDSQARDDAWLRGVLEAAAAEGYGEDIVFMLARLLSLNPAERRSAAELHEFLLEQA